MKSFFLIVFSITLVLAPRAEALPLSLTDQSLRSPIATDPLIVNDASPGHPVASVLLGAWAGSMVNLATETPPLIGLGVMSVLISGLFGSDTRPDFLALDKQGQWIFALYMDVAPTLASAGAIYGITRAMGGHPSFWKICLASLAVRTAVSALSVAVTPSNTSDWATGVLLIGPALGLATEIVTSQLEFDGADRVAAPAAARTSAESHATVFPLMAKSF